jgi:hypothetical protein
MLLSLRDQTGAPVIVNSDHVLYIAQAADEATHAPLLGFSIVFMNTNLIQGSGGQVQPYGILIKGAPDEVKALIESQQPFAGLTQ